MKLTCEKPTTVYELIGQTTALGRKLIVPIRPEGQKYNELLRDCGNCIGCKLRRRMDIATRLEHESKYHHHNWFLTLTYDPEHLPYGNTLVHDHISKFVRALRKKMPKNKIRFFGVGEYGDPTQENDFIARPHYHVILFGPNIPDKQLLHTDPSYNKFASEQFKAMFGIEGIHWYTSELIANTWGKGQIQFSDVSPATMQYVAKYHIDKITGEAAEEHYRQFVESTGETIQREPEQARMSRNPGIGRKWIEDFYPDVYPDGHITNIKGEKFAPPKYYDRWLEQHHPDQYEQLKIKRQESITLEQQLDKTREDLIICRNAHLKLTEEKKGNY